QGLVARLHGIPEIKKVVILEGCSKCLNPRHLRHDVPGPSEKPVSERIAEVEDGLERERAKGITPEEGEDRFAVLAPLLVFAISESMFHSAVGDEDDEPFGQAIMPHPQVVAIEMEDMARLSRPD